MMHPLLLELNARCWLRSLSEQTGGKITLANVPAAEFEIWRDLGLTHLWLMGAWTTGPRSREISRASAELQREFKKLLPRSSADDFAGSPYAIAKYEVPASLGGETGLKLFREQLNAQGIKLLLDFVPNHTGLDHAWLSEKPELFVQSIHELPETFAEDTKAGQRWLAHGRDPCFPPWRDTTQLDHRRPDTRGAVIEELRLISQQCDGVRCDMAMLLLNDVFAKTWADFPTDTSSPATEFWADAISAVKREHPDFFFLAEAYWGLESRLQSLGFDFTYGKTVYDFLIARKPMELHEYLFVSSPDLLSASAHFLENHDETRIASLLSGAEYRAAALLILSLPGTRMLYDGQLQGRRLRVPIQFARWPDEPVDAEILHFYRRLLPILKDSAVGHGDWKLLRVAHEISEAKIGTVIAIQWQESPGWFDLVVVNFDSSAHKCVIQPEFSGGNPQAWQTRKLLQDDGSGVKATPVVGSGEFLLELKPYAAQILRFSAAS